MANGAILWEGPSELDGAPVMLVATGLKRGSQNVKTGGALVQTWILRSDVNPVDAVHSGDDASICGDCVHRGDVVDGRNVGRSCYVAVYQAPRSIYDAMTRGVYARATLAEARAILAARPVRLGAYGDPAAIPAAVWAEILADAGRGTGYTHQWRHAPALAAWCMASVESTEEAAEARAMGFRCFRVGTAAEKIARGEFLCPASKEAGHKLSCDSCLACGGSNAPNRADVFIYVHGMTAKRRAFEARR